VGVLTLVDRQEGAEERILSEAGVPLVALFTGAELLEIGTPV
jgi:orotate phosphoribosyltransferase